MPQHPFIVFHTVSILIAFAVSFWIFGKPKGTKLHKILGRIFVISMLLSLISSFFIQTEGHLSPIHILSGMGIYWIIKGVVVVRFKKKNWRALHSSSMVSAYISILIAGAGVIGRHFFFPGQTSLGFLLSGIVALPTIFLARRYLKNMV